MTVNVIVRTVIDNIDIEAFLKIYRITDPTTYDYIVISESIGRTETTLEEGLYYFYAYLIDKLGYLWSSSDWLLTTQNIAELMADFGAVNLGIPIDDRITGAHHFPKPPIVKDVSIPQPPPKVRVTVRAFVGGEERALKGILIDYDNWSITKFTTPWSKEKDYGTICVVVYYEDKQSTFEFYLAPGETKEVEAKFEVSPPGGSCTIDADCPSGYVCLNGTCVARARPPATIFDRLWTNFESFLKRLGLPVPPKPPSPPSLI